jgi:hypothetical protein
VHKQNNQSALPITTGRLCYKETANYDNALLWYLGLSVDTAESISYVCIKRAIRFKNESDSSYLLTK